MSAPTPATTVAIPAAPTAAAASAASAGSSNGSPAAPAATTTGTRCHTADLSAKAVSAGAALGNEGQVLTLENTGSTACTLDGYPGIGLVTAAGESSVTVGRGSGMLARDPGAASVELPAGGTASATLTYSTGASGAGCVAKVVSIEVTPPDETAALKVAVPMGIFNACGAHITALIAGSKGPQPG